MSTDLTCSHSCFPTCPAVTGGQGLEGCWPARAAASLAFRGTPGSKVAPGSKVLGHPVKSKGKLSPPAAKQEQLIVVSEASPRRLRGGWLQHLSAPQCTEGTSFMGSNLGWGPFTEECLSPIPTASVQRAREPGSVVVRWKGGKRKGSGWITQALLASPLLQCRERPLQGQRAVGMSSSPSPHPTRP